MVSVAIGDALMESSNYIQRRNKSIVIDDHHKFIPTSFNQCNCVVLVDGTHSSSLLAGVYFPPYHYTRLIASSRSSPAGLFTEVISNVESHRLVGLKCVENVLNFADKHAHYFHIIRRVRDVSEMYI